ncbi:serine/threonine-protein phosphatase [bacterium c-19]|nr:serine/threonine-protein phosphatase [bacterium c-19]
MIYSYYSDCGNFKKRNEDAYELHVAASSERMHGMLAVCDGVSTSDDGSYASRFVIAQLHELFAKRNNQAIDWKAEIYRIHDALCAAGLRRRKRYGTTLSLFYFEDDNYHFLQVGDSRIYLYRHSLYQLSIDQTLAQQKYQNQTISLEEYRRSDEHHILTQCIGITKQLQLAEGHGSWRTEDGVLVCSDGISNLLSLSMLNEHMKLFLAEGSDEAKKLAEEALAYGEKDNLTALMFSREQSS